MSDKLRVKRNKIIGRAMKISRVKTAFDNAWYIHARMFGDIMDPAFTDDMAARFELVAALNLISRGDMVRGMKKLDNLFKFCNTDEDFAAWYFFVGVCYEKTGLRERAAVLLTESAKREPKFYMVYLLLAKCLHEEKHYEAALGGYMRALECALNMPQRDELPAVRSEPLIGSSHGNMAACLVMMRQYDEAEYELYEAQSFGYSPPQLNLSWAMLYAATDRKQQAREKMAVLRKELPEFEAKYALTVEEILAQKNPRFALQKPEFDKLRGFWDWFSEVEERLYDAFKLGIGYPGFKPLEDKLRELFGHNGETVRFSLSRDGGKTCISFFDNYNLTYGIWLDKLIELAPKQITDKWSFYAVH